jgi:gluconate 2-dehydrogenase gamma chain
VNRRVFLQRIVQVLSASYLSTLPGCGWLKTRKPKSALPVAVHMSPQEVELCAAACDAVLPPDNEPGAVQMGVVEYIDRRFDRTHEEPARFTNGLRKLDEWSRTTAGHGFLDLPQASRERTLSAWAAKGGPEGRSFVDSLVLQTLEGALSDPAYGGNRNRAGWTLIGFQVPCPNPSCP